MLLFLLAGISFHGLLAFGGSNSPTRNRGISVFLTADRTAASVVRLRRRAFKTVPLWGSPIRKPGTRSISLFGVRIYNNAYEHKLQDLKVQKQI